MQDSNPQNEITDVEIVEIVAIEDDSELDFEALAACQGPTISK